MMVIDTSYIRKLLIFWKAHTISLCGDIHSKILQNSFHDSRENCFFYPEIFQRNHVDPLYTYTSKMPMIVFSLKKTPLV